MLKNSADVAETLRHSFCFCLFLLTYLPFVFFFFRFSSHLFSGQLLSACLNLFQLVSTQLISAFISSSQLFSALRGVSPKAGHADGRTGQKAAQKTKSTSSVQAARTILTVALVLSSSTPRMALPVFGFRIPFCRICDAIRTVVGGFED